MSEAEAIRIALSREDDLENINVVLTRSGGRLYYAGTAYEDDDEMYIFEIDAYTGYITRWDEIDLDDDDDDD